MKKAIGNGPIGGNTHIKIKEPNSYEGLRSVKTLGNPLWDMEKYLEHFGLPNEEAKVKVVSIFLTKDAETCWIRRQTRLLLVILRTS